MTTSSTATHAGASAESLTPLRRYLTVAEAARLLHRKAWAIVEAIEAGELRASMPSNEGAWLIRPADLVAYVERFTNDSPDTLLESRAVRLARHHAEVDAELAEEGLLEGAEASS